MEQDITVKLVAKLSSGRSITLNLSGTAQTDDDTWWTADSFARELVGMEILVNSLGRIRMHLFARTHSEEPKTDSARMLSEQIDFAAGRSKEYESDDKREVD